MIIGMVPMAIGGPGEEQNASLARAVIGGLVFATPTTLLIVPYLFAMLRRRSDLKPAQDALKGASDVGPETVIAASAREAPAARPTTAQPRRAGRRLFALGVLVLLVGSLVVGLWQHYGRYSQAMTTAATAARLRPPRSGARGTSERRHHAGNAAGDDSWLRDGKHLWACQRLYQQATRRHRLACQAGRFARGSHGRPRLDHQDRAGGGDPRQVKATLAQTEANRDLARVTAERSTALAPQGAASRQQADNDRLAYRAQQQAAVAQEATIKAQQAQLMVCATEDLSAGGGAFRWRRDAAEYRRR